MDLFTTFETGVMQDRISIPSASTEQQPHWPNPHPKRGPCSARSSVSTYKRGVSGATVTVRVVSFTRRRSSLAIRVLPANFAYLRLNSMVLVRPYIRYIISFARPHPRCACQPGSSAVGSDGAEHPQA